MSVLKKLFSPSVLPGLIVAVAILGLWEVASLKYTRSFLPSIEEIGAAIVDVFEENSPISTYATTLWRVLAGLAISLIIGTAIGMAMGLRKQVEGFMANWIMVLLTFPAIAWAFLGVIWFGLATWVPVLVVVAIAVPFVTMNAWSGTKAMDKELIDMAKSFKAPLGLRMRKVLLPQLMPFVFSSLRIGFAVSWKIVLIGEAFGIPNGVGRKIVDEFGELRVHMILGWAVPFMLIMLLIEFGVFRWWERGVFNWRHQLGT